MKREDIFAFINYERHRQNGLHPKALGEDFLAVLTEEFLEVLQAIQNKDEDNLFEEVIQLASVCVRYLEEQEEKKEE